MDFEVKYKINPLKVVDVEYWLDRTLRLDPQFPQSMVSSIYFDSLSLSSLREKLDGDYVKTKFRIRWYSSFDQLRLSNLFTVAQVKRKVGNRRFKETIPVNIDTEWLHTGPLDSTKLFDYQNQFRSMKYFPSSYLIPVVLVRYRRKRYLDELSGLRVCIDYNIQAPFFSSLIFGHPRPLNLNAAVLEVKGLSEEFPKVLQPLIRMGCRKTEFSKYASCISNLALGLH